MPKLNASENVALGGIAGGTNAVRLPFDVFEKLYPYLLRSIGPLLNRPRNGRFRDQPRPSRCLITNDRQKRSLRASPLLTFCRGDNIGWPHRRVRNSVYRFEDTTVRRYLKSVAKLCRTIFVKNSWLEIIEKNEYTCWVDFVAIWRARFLWAVVNAATVVFWKIIDLVSVFTALSCKFLGKKRIRIFPKYLQILMELGTYYYYFESRKFLKQISFIDTFFWALKTVFIY